MKLVSKSAWPLAIVLSIALLGALTFADKGQTDAVSPNGSTVAGNKFDHAAHAARKTGAIEECLTCHTVDLKGKLDRPGASGHQPCLAVGCHASDFISVGERTKKEDRSRYDKASNFCSGCHASTGTQLAPSVEMQADNLYKNNLSPGHYVEMNHLEHVGKTECRKCHVVDAASFELSQTSPGHAQCATCHTENDDVQMEQCAKCHQNGDPSSYYKPRLDSSDVRSCNSDRYRALVKSRLSKKPPPCFKHETKSHRFQRDGSELECGQCHFMFKAESLGRHRYVSLQDIKQAPLIENRRGQSHKRCGTSGCHRKDVDDSQGRGRCSLCHGSNKAKIESTLSD